MKMYAAWMRLWVLQRNLEERYVVNFEVGDVVSAAREMIEPLKVLLEGSERPTAPTKDRIGLGHYIAMMHSALAMCDDIDQAREPLLWVVLFNCEEIVRNYGDRSGLAQESEEEVADTSGVIRDGVSTESRA